MPKVRDSSGTIGITSLPRLGSLSSVVRMRTKDMVVETPRSPLSFSCVAKALSGGTASGATLPERDGT